MKDPVFTIIHLVSIILVSVPVCESRDTFDYFHKYAAKSVLKEYVFKEIDPRSYMLCPKDYFIGEVNFTFVHSIPKDRTINRKIGVFSFNWTDVSSDLLLHSASPSSVQTDCSTIIRCLGYQACLFNLKNEFCQTDPVPGLRKVLHVNISCKHDSDLKNIYTIKQLDRNKNSQAFQNLKVVKSRIDLVLHIKAPTLLKSKDYRQVILKPFENQEKDVFDVKSYTEFQIRQRFTGQCYPSLLSSQQIVQDLWSVLGRTKTTLCRNEILDVYSAYHYNIQGECVPNILQSKDNALAYKGRPVTARDNDNLTPVKIGFIIMAHEGPDILVDLLHRIYRREHYYVIHIDKRSTDMRKKLLHEKYIRSLPNVHILSLVESYVTSWGSYQILHAELQGIKRLLLMGQWDFVINLSLADIPLQSVDVLAASLAQYRGANFINKYGEKTGENIEYAWHDCDEHVWNVTRRDRTTKRIFNSSQWILFSRQFAEYLLNHVHSSFHFFLRTTFIPDESYFLAVLHNSQFSSTRIDRNLHYMKQWVGLDKNNLCRHHDEVDFSHTSCGQSPGIMTVEDLPNLLQHSFHFFFTRKISMSKNDPVRSIKLPFLNFLDTAHIQIQGERGLHFPKHRFLYRFYEPRHIIQEAALKNFIAEKVHVLMEKQLGSNIHGIFKLKHYIMFPIIAPKSACPIKMPLNEEFAYWIDYIGPSGQKVRALVHPKPYTKCISRGAIRGIQAVAISERANVSDPFVNAAHPIPYQAAGAKIIHFNLIITDERSIIVNEEQEKLAYMTDKHVELNIWLKDPLGKTVCRFTNAFYQETNDFRIHAYELNCGDLFEGWWTVHLQQTKVENAHVYSHSIYLKDDKNPRWDESALETLYHVEKIKIYENQTKSKSPHVAKNHNKSKHKGKIHARTYAKKYSHKEKKIVEGFEYEENSTLYLMLGISGTVIPLTICIVLALKRCCTKTNHLTQTKTLLVVVLIMQCISVVTFYKAIPKPLILSEHDSLR